jgi:phospholipase C
MKTVVIVGGAVFAFSACTSPTFNAPSVPPTSGASESASAVSAGRSFADGAARGSSPITHVVIIFQENRTVDNLFQGLAGADTQPYGFDSHGNRVSLHRTSLAWDNDISHTHGNFLIECNPTPTNGSCRGNGWDLALTKKRCDAGDCAFAYVPRSEVQPYFDMANQYVFGDRMFQTNEGPSFPAHQEIISGTAAAAPLQPHRQISENPRGGGRVSNGGCDSPNGSHVPTIPLAPIGAPEGGRLYPCFDRPTLPDLIPKSSDISWRYYQCGTGAGLWHAFDAIQHLKGSDNVIARPEQILTDIASHSLASISWVTPDAKHSDHSGFRSRSGPSWVAAVVNAIGQSNTYWNSTAIVVTWDDWGGWFDHANPVRRNNYELSFRVPLLVISPYAKKGYVSHVPHEFGSILHFAEEVFGLKSLGTTDATSDDLRDAFDFSQTPRKFQTISAPAFTSACAGSDDLPDD